MDLLEKIKSLPTNKIKVAITDIDGVLRGKVIHHEKFLSAMQQGFGFCDVIFGWDINDSCYDNAAYTGWHTGYPDAHAVIDADTFRQIPWDNDIPFFLADFLDADGAPLQVCPRQLLKKIRAQAADEGFEANFAQEFEWFNFAEQHQELHDRSFLDPQPISRGMFGYSLLRSGQSRAYFNDIFDSLAAFDVTLEGLHTETGPGVYEAAILYDDVLRAADKAVLFKASIKDIAHRHGIVPSFMAKWHDDLPGCSGHLHQSLRCDSCNVFHDDRDPRNISPLMRQYAAGILHCLPHVLPMYAPTVNSYKRLVEGAWAPTTLTWGIDNRTVALRLLPGSEKATRLELRVPGSDVNPYLAMAASLASGLYGIKNQLELQHPETLGNGYSVDDQGTLPRDLNEATQQFKESDIARSLFGDTFVDHFSATREWEWRQFRSKVTDWELKRYFELV